MQRIATKEHNARKVQARRTQLVWNPKYLLVQQLMQMENKREWQS
jgi:hypothetical protein